MATAYGPIQLRRDTVANWRSADPTLLNGEVGVAQFANGRIGLKFGGATAITWNDSTPPFIGYEGGTFGHGSGAEFDVNQPYNAPGIVVTGRTKRDGQFNANVGLYGVGGFLCGYVGTDTGTGSVSKIAAGRPGTPASIHLGLAGGYCYAENGGKGYIYNRGPGVAMGGVFAGGGGTSRLWSLYGWAGGYVAYWGDQGGTVDTTVYAGFSGLAFGYAAYGGKVQAVGGVAFGKAYGPGTLVRASGYGLAAGYASSGSNATLSPAPVTEIRSSGSGAFAGGSAVAAVASSGAKITASGSGALAFGESWSTAATNTEILASAKGAWAGGYAKAELAGGTAYITSTNEGALAFGKARITTTGQATIEATWDAAVAIGYALVVSTGDVARVVSNGLGSLAMGAAESGGGSGGTAYIKSLAAGSFAGGYAGTIAAGTGTKIVADNHGAIAFGRGKSGGYIHAAGQGALAMGYANSTGVIYAASQGSLAFGDAAAGETIQASGRGAVQFGPGTNSVQDSVAVGTDLRLNANGAPGTPRNGDIWVASNHVYIRQNGVTGKIAIY